MRSPRRTHTPARPPSRRTGPSSRRPPTRPRRRSEARCRRRESGRSFSSACATRMCSCLRCCCGMPSISTSTTSSCVNAKSPPFALADRSKETGVLRLRQRESHGHLAPGARRDEQADVEFAAGDRRRPEHCVRARRESLEAMGDQRLPAGGNSQLGDRRPLQRVPLCQTNPSSTSALKRCAMKSGLPSVCR